MLDLVDINELDEVASPATMSTMLEICNVAYQSIQKENIMEERTYHRKSLGTEKLIVPSFIRPVWQDQQMTCGNCRFNDQDIDTCPCAKCHTRN